VAGAQETGQPGQTESVDHDVTEQHRQDRRSWAPVPAVLGQQPHQVGSDHQAGQEAAGRTGQTCEADPTAGKDRQADRPFRKVEEQSVRAQPPISRAARVWPVIGTGLNGSGIATWALRATSRLAATTQVES
jgi:hypothetical protein